MKNYFAVIPTTALSISLWFRSMGMEGGNEALVCNTGCADGRSFIININNRVAQAKLSTSCGDTSDQAEMEAKVICIFLYKFNHVFKHSPFGVHCDSV